MREANDLEWLVLIFWKSCTDASLKHGRLKGHGSLPFTCGSGFCSGPPVFAHPLSLSTWYGWLRFSFRIKPKQSKRSRSSPPLGSLSHTILVCV